MKNKPIICLTESAIMIALSTILGFVAIMKMPYGGSITACSLLPIIIIAYRRGTAWGLLTGLAYSILQLILGMDNLSYATSWKAGVAIVLLDYILASTVLGLGGIFKGRINNEGNALAMGALLCCIIKYICHVISGCTVWAGVSIPDKDGLIYSLIYNVAYMLPETLITVFAAYFVGRSFNLSSSEIRRVIRKNTDAGFSLLGAFLLSGAVVADMIILFSAMQSEEGFDITLVKDNANFIVVIAVFVIGVIGAVLANMVKKQRNNKKNANA